MLFRTFVSPGRGVLAGCMQSMYWVNFHVHDILDLAQIQYRPAQVTAYVGDLTQSQVGYMKEVLDNFAPAALLLAHQPEGVGCAISQVCSRSHAELGRELAARYRATALPIKLQAAARDLGVMTTAGKRRSAVQVAQQGQEGCSPHSHRRECPTPAFTRGPRCRFATPPNFGALSWADLTEEGPNGHM
eukprot:8755449-Pyramimonas_sp.AAC.1